MFNEKGVKPRFSNDTRLKCGHAFHRNCIKQWLVQNDTCPMCRQDMKFREGGYFKCFVYLFQFRKFVVFDEEEWYDVYIYHDNAGAIMFINYVKQNGLHFTYPFVLFYITTKRN
jgi:hypothetical protein